MLRNILHLSEYPADRWKSREWISGFTGSAGTLVIGEKEAALFVDGRYFIQAEWQIAGSGITLMRMGTAGTPKLEEYLAALLHENDALGVDFKELMPRYTGRPLFSPREGRRVHPLTGAVQRWVPNQDGGYWDHCDFPLAEADDETIANWPVPDPDDFDYDELLDRCKLYRHKAVHFGHPGVSDVMNNTGMIRGMENIYMDLALETESVMTLLDRRMKAELAMFERALDKCRDYVDFIWTGEDLGTQRAPLISLDMFRAQIRPRHQPLIDLASSYGKPVMIHCCGSSSWAFEDFIEMGIRAVDTLQPEAADMDPACLARKYGGRLAFHGCISTAKLAVMTPEAVAQNVAETLETMMPHHGYCLAPTHYLQDNTPVENVIAMYRTAHRLGRY